VRADKQFVSKNFHQFTIGKLQKLNRRQRAARRAAPLVKSCMLD
jgi:hypothetical protein